MSNMKNQRFNKIGGSNNSSGNSSINNEKSARTVNSKQNAFIGANKSKSYFSIEKKPLTDKTNNSNSKSGNKQVIEGFLSSYEDRIKANNKHYDGNNSTSTNSSTQPKLLENKMIMEKERELIRMKEIIEAKELKEKEEDRIKKEREKAIRESEERIKREKEIKEREERIKKETEKEEERIRIEKEKAMKDNEDKVRLVKEKEKKEKEDQLRGSTLLGETLITSKVNTKQDNIKPQEVNVALNSAQLDIIDAPDEQLPNTNDKNTDTTTKKTNTNKPKCVLKSETEEKDINTNPILSNTTLTSTTTSTSTLTKNTNSTAISISPINDISNNTVGLDNLGNTCFMNTCLQIIIHSSSFITRLYQSKDFITSSTPRSKPISKSFLNLCEETKSSHFSSSISPSSFKSSFGHKHFEYLGYSQHDTQEFCRLFLEDLNKELNLVIKVPPYKELNCTNKSKTVLNKDYDHLFKERENSIVIDSFYGQTVNIFRCICSFESYSFEKFLDLPLLLDNSEYETQHLDDLIKKNFAKETIQWGEKCESCSKKTMHDKAIKLSYLPDVLFISFQRFNPRTKRKNSTRIQFTEALNLGEYVDMECIENQTTGYNLIGVSNHSGSIDFGHYYAYVKLKEGWYEFNDSRVFKIGTISNTSNTAYILAYQREDC